MFDVQSALPARSISAREEGRRVAPIGRAAAFAFAVTSALLASAAGPPYDVWPLALVAWAPLLVALHGRSPRDALLLGGVQGLAYRLVAGTWMPGVVRTFGELPWAACWAISLVIFAYDAGRTALVAWLSVRAERRGWPMGAAFVVALLACESAYPLLFPWYTAVQVHRAPVWMQLAEVGGPALVGVPIACANVALAEIAWARLDRRALDRRRVLRPLAIVAAALLFGAWRIAAVDRAVAEAPKATVAIVQANLPHAGATLEESIDAHRAPTAQLEAAAKRFDLVVWPETALNGVVDADLLASTLRGVVHGRSGAPLASALLTGAIVRRGDELRNSAVLFAGDAVRGVYDKRHPLLFGEYVPFGSRFPVLYRWIPNAGRIVSGTSDAPLVLGDHRISALICYEDLLTEAANRAIASAQPDLLVNLTNDSWFGQSTAAATHLALAKFRAIEHRRYLVRATNSGVSAFVDPVGRVSHATPLLEPATAVETVRWMRTTTLYERIGDAAGWCAAIAIAAMALVRPRRRSA